jgi:hypothetical protein
LKPEFLHRRAVLQMEAQGPRRRRDAPDPVIRLEGITMNVNRTLGSLLLLAGFATTAHAQAEKTREQVRAELAEAIRTGDVLAGGDSGLKLNELYPQRYPRSVATATTSREQVKAEFAEAVRTGNVFAAGEGAFKLNEESPQRYPVATVLAGKTRAEVKAELAEAIRTGDMVPAGEAGMKLNEQFPQRYARSGGCRPGDAGHRCGERVRALTQSWVPRS